METSQPTRRRPFKIGVIVPNEEGEMAGATPRWNDYLAMARTIEDAGFDSLWIADHLLDRAEDGDAVGSWEGWSMLTALAAVTDRVEIGSFVTCAAFRNPALLAKMADTVDEISGGRLILGLGAGWVESEFRAFGFPFDHRVSRFEEAVTIIHGLLRDGHIDFAGTYHQARDCELRPRGPRPTGPPIMIGTTGARMLRLTARYADLWNAFFWEQGTGNRAERVPALQTAVDAACVEVGRDPKTLIRSATVMVNTIPAAGQASWTSMKQMAGSPEQIATELRRYADAGISHLQLWPQPASLAGFEELLPVLELLDRG